MICRASCIFASITVAALVTACSTGRPEPETRLVLAGQALIKKDPRMRWDDPFGSLRPMLDRADVAFTNFEMAVLSEADRCGIPTDYEVSFGTPRLTPEDRPGNSGGPHAVAPDRGDCGVVATRAAAEA